MKDIKIKIWKKYIILQLYVKLINRLKSHLFNEIYHSIVVVISIFIYLQGE